MRIGRIIAPTAFVELDAEGRSNVDVLRRHVEQHGDESTGNAGATNESGDGVNRLIDGHLDEEQGEQAREVLEQLSK